MDQSREIHFRLFDDPQKIRHTSSPYQNQVLLPRTQSREHRAHHHTTGSSQVRRGETNEQSRAKLKTHRKLSEQTRERLLASPASSTAATSLKNDRQRRLSGRDNPGFFSGYRSENEYSINNASLSQQQQPPPAPAMWKTSAPKGHYNVIGYARSKNISGPDLNGSEDIESAETGGLPTNQIRSATSLESLDSISNSIQQARAQSLMRRRESLLKNGGPNLEKQSWRSLLVDDRGGQVPTSNSIQDSASQRGYEYLSNQLLQSYSADYSQRTFPLRKSTFRHPGLDSVGGSTSDIGSSSLQEGSQLQGTSFAKTGKVPNTTAAHPLSSVDFARLQRELQEEREKVLQLTNQLSTNAHVVSAFEHSLSNMTTRLAKLTNETEQKDKELLNLRQEILSNRQSQPFDYSSKGGMRWKSDDNVLSTSNSSTSGFQSQFNVINRKHSKSGKKNTWFRSSLNKAFRVRRFSQSNSSICDSNTDLATSNGYNSADETRENRLSNSEPPNLKSNQRSISVSALDGVTMDEMQRQLLAKDDLLTETRLEALSSASQLQSLREAVAKMRQELKYVKLENEDLKHQLISSTKQASRHSNHRPRSSLILSCCSTLAPMGQAREVLVFLEDVPIGRLILPHLHSPELFRLNLHDLDESLRRLYGMFMARLDPNCLLGLIECNQSLEGFTFLGWTRNFPLDGECDEAERMDKPLSWGDGESLGSALVRGRGKPHHLLIQEEQANGRDGLSEIRLAFKSNAVQQLAFETLRPLDEVENYVQTLLDERLILLCGPQSSGKTFLATQLLRTCLRTHSGQKSVACSSIISIDCAERQLEGQSQDILSEMLSGSSQNNGEMTAFLLETVDSTLAKHLLEQKESLMRRNILVIATTEKNEQVFPADMTHVSPLSGYLPHLIGFVLRKRLLGQEVLDGTLAHPELMSGVTWLALVCKTLHQRSSWVPKLHIFLECPLEGSRQFRQWFVNTWNAILVHELRRTSKLQLDDKGEDPVKFVIRTWPWKDESGSLQRDLQRVFDGRCRPHWSSRSDSSATEERVKPDGAEDPLMNMLLCLQQATLETNGKAMNS